MLTELSALARLFVEQTLALLPWFMLAVLLGVFVSMLSLDVVARRVFRQHGVLAIACTAAIGAFSPFCSFTVIPLIRKFLRTGVPLSAVMAFWIASPSMSPEIFGLSASQLGLPLAFTRLVGACVLSIGAGLLVLALERRGHLRNPLREEYAKEAEAPSCGKQQDAVASAVARASVQPNGHPAIVTRGGCAGEAQTATDDEEAFADAGHARRARMDFALAGMASATSLGSTSFDEPPASEARRLPLGAPATPSDEPPRCDKDGSAKPTCGSASIDEDDGQPWWPQAAADLRQLEWRKVLREVWDDSMSLGKWLLIAVVIEVLVLRYVPQHVVSDALGGAGLLAFPLATILSVPLYMNGLSAIPIVDGLVIKGMLPGAAVTFLLAGSVTTIPALVAVRAVVRRQIFWLYVGVSVLGSLALGLISSLWL